MYNIDEAILKRFVSTSKSPGALVDIVRRIRSMDPDRKGDGTGKKTRRGSIPSPSPFTPVTPATPATPAIPYPGAAATGLAGIRAQVKAAAAERNSSIEGGSEGPGGGGGGGRGGRGGGGTATSHDRGEKSQKSPNLFISLPGQSRRPTPFAAASAMGRRDSGTDSTGSGTDTSARRIKKAGETPSTQPQPPSSAPASEGSHTGEGAGPGTTEVEAGGSQAPSDPGTPDWGQSDNDGASDWN